MSITTRRVRQVAQGRTGHPADTHEAPRPGRRSPVLLADRQGAGGLDVIVFDPESGHILSAVEKDPHKREEAVRQLVEWMS